MLNNLNNEEKRQLVVTYGFEYDKVITLPSGCRICKSILNNNIIYSSVMIRDYSVKNIINKIRIAESKRNYYFYFIDDLAELMNVKPKWQLAIYDSSFSDYIDNKIKKSLSKLKDF